MVGFHFALWPEACCKNSAAVSGRQDLSESSGSFYRSTESFFWFLTHVENILLNGGYLMSKFNNHFGLVSNVPYLIQTKFHWICPSGMQSKQTAECLACVLAKLKDTDFLISDFVEMKCLHPTAAAFELWFRLTSSVGASWAWAVITRVFLRWHTIPLGQLQFPALCYAVASRSPCFNVTLTKASPVTKLLEMYEVGGLEDFLLFRRVWESHWCVLAVDSWCFSNSAAEIGRK